MKKYGFGRNANLVLAGYFLFMLSYSGLFFLVANLYLLRLGFDVAFVGQVNSAAFFAYCLVSIPAGILVSRWGLRRSMVGGSLFMALALAWFAGVELLPVALHKVSLAAGEAAIGVGGAFFMACVIPCLMETESSRRAAVLSASAMASLVAASLGSLAGGGLTALSSLLIGLPQSSPVPYRLALIVVVAVQLGAAACVASIRPTAPSAAAPGEKRDPESAPPARAPFSLLAVAVGSGVLLAVFGASVQTFFSLHLDQTFRVPTQSIGTALAVARGVPAFAFVLSPLLVKRFGAYRTAVVATVASTAVAASVGLAPWWLLAAAGYTLMGFVSSLGGPATSLLYQGAVAAPARPVVAGATNAAYGLGGGTVLFAGGFAIERLGYGRFFLAGLAVQVVGVVIFAVYFGRRARVAATSRAA